MLISKLHKIPLPCRYGCLSLSFTLPNMITCDNSFLLPTAKAVRRKLLLDERVQRVFLHVVESAFPASAVLVIRAPTGARSAAVKVRFHAVVLQSAGRQADRGARAATGRGPLRLAQAPYDSLKQVLINFEII